MGRGLGKTQRAVLDHLKKDGSATAGWMAFEILNSERDEYGDPLTHNKPTRAQVQSVKNAIHALHRRGLVEIAETHTGRWGEGARMEMTVWLPAVEEPDRVGQRRSWGDLTGPIIQTMNEITLDEIKEWIENGCYLHRYYKLRFAAEKGGSYTWDRWERLAHNLPTLRPFWMPRALVVRRVLDNQGVSRLDGWILDSARRAIRRALDNLIGLGQVDVYESSWFCEEDQRWYYTDHRRRRDAEGQSPASFIRCVVCVQEDTATINQEAAS